MSHIHHIYLFTLLEFIIYLHLVLLHYLALSQQSVVFQSPMRFQIPAVHQNTVHYHYAVFYQ